MRLCNCLFFLGVFLFSACRKDEHITTDPSVQLTVSNSTVLFDTIFSSVGSVTKRLRIFNHNADALKIREIKLAGGNSSSFNLNINGEPINSKSDLLVHGKDSLNIFIKATINPTAQHLPFLIQDSIIISYNGNRQVIQLMAYGQNAIFVNEKSIQTDTNWSEALPYVINGSVTVKKGSTLTIAPGSKLYFHKDASLNVEGFLNVNGTLNQPALFCSDRMESVYNDEPGQWKGIFLSKTGNAVIKNAVIKNALVGITSDSLSQNRIKKLILSNCTIKNMQVAAYIGYHSEMLAFNNLMYNCGNYLIYAVGGGNYNLKQNTFAGYNADFPRKTAALSFSDFLSNKVYNDLNVELANNIIYGSLDNELNFEKKSTANVALNLLNNLIKTNNGSFNHNFINIDPGFIAANSGNFELRDNSTAIKKGYSLVNDPYYAAYLNMDIKNVQRLFPSTLGCYEMK